jgi:ribonuclease G
VREIMSRPCPTCDGEGVIRSEETISIEFERRLRELAASKPDVEAFLVQMNPRVTVQFTGHGARVLRALEAQTGKYFHFEGSEGLALNHLAVTLEGTREEVEERAVPFRPGEEVLVEIVEPHMYNVDDAVAKIDGYIISVTDGGAHVGQKLMVRIEEVGRTAAVASLIDVERPDGSDGPADAAPDDVQSPSRRRGRRGGRRRTAATATAPAAPEEV